MTKQDVNAVSLALFLESLHGKPGDLDAWLEVTIEADVRAHVEAAIAAERKRCAKVCDEFSDRLRSSGCKHEAAAVETVAEEIRNA